MEQSLPLYKIALFASGNGTNVQRICEYFAENEHIRPVVLFCNHPQAYVIERARKLKLPVVMITRKTLEDPGFMLPVLQQYGVTHLVLAGFLALIPAWLVDVYPEKIVNIHPALLPKFGGKGMYGEHVHEAVVAAGEKESGITVHLADKEFDHGRTLFQARCAVEPGDTPDDVAAKIHALEQAYFPVVIEEYVLGVRTSRSVCSPEAS